MGNHAPAARLFSGGVIVCQARKRRAISRPFWVVNEPAGVPGRRHSKTVHGRLLPTRSRHPVGSEIGQPSVTPAWTPCVYSLPQLC